VRNFGGAKGDSQAVALSADAHGENFVTVALLAALLWQGPTNRGRVVSRRLARAGDRYGLEETDGDV
jgi:hypothetical protein